MELNRMAICISLIFFFVSCNDKNANVAIAQTNESIETIQKNEKPKEKVWSEEFASHMKKAKEYEENKQWIWALNEYYNALETYKDYDEADIAYSAYRELADIIRSGKPGRGEFDTFSLYDEWKALLIETENYANKIFPYEIYFGSFIATSLDRETKTGNYTVAVDATLSTRFLKTVGVVSTGYKNVDKNGWNDLPSSFPGKPVTANSFSSELCSKDYGHVRQEKTNAFAIALRGGVTKPFGALRVIPYEAIFTIVNKNGEILAESQPTVIGSFDEDYDWFDYDEKHFKGRKSIAFKNVSESCIKAIEAKQAYVTCKEIKMMYGKIFYTEKNLSGGKKTDVFFYPADIHFQKSIILSKAKHIFALCSKGIMFDPAYTINNKQIHCIFFDSEEVFSIICGVFTEKEIEDNQFDWERGSKSYIVCNELSKLYGRQPVYNVNGSTELCDLWANDHNIAADGAADGFRMPTIDFVEKFVESGKNVGIPQVKSGTSMFTYTYNYYTIDSIAQNNSYMMLYYVE